MLRHGQVQAIRSGQAGSAGHADRAGVSLAEVAVAVVVLFLLSTAVLPGVVRTLDRERVEMTVSELQEIANAMHSMRSDNQDWPSKLSHLSAPIHTGQNNICGGRYQQGKVNNWDGPYLDRVVPPSGFKVGVGVMPDTVLRDPPQSGGRGGSAFGDMIVLIDGVAEEDAIELSRLIDGNESATSGAIQWTATDADAGIVRVRFIRPIKQC